MFRSVVEKPVDETNRETVPLGFRRECRNAEWNASVASDRAHLRSGAPGGRSPPLLKGSLLRYVMVHMNGVGGASC